MRGLSARVASDLALRASGVSKHFGATQALSGVDFDLRRGEIHAVLGENGAGKSTLMKIFGGLLPPDGGALFVKGREISLDSPQDAFREGISVVHQELSLMLNLSVGENLCLQSPPLATGLLGRSLGVVDRAEIRRRTQRASEMLGTNFEPRTRVASLGPAYRQLVEIGRALLGSSQILLLDEPTSSLPPAERKELFVRLDALRDQGIAIIFITHMLEEALSLCDRVTVLRDGANVGTRAKDETSVAELIHLMTGHEAGSVFPGSAGGDRAGVPRLRVRSLAVAPRVSDVSFDVSPGEIVGLAGLVGSGRTETLKAVFGASGRQDGTVEIDGTGVEFSGTRQAIDAGVAYIPEDRQGEGLFPDHSVLSNITIAAANTTRGDSLVRRGVIIDQRRRGRLARDFVERLGVKTPSVSASISQLSGGNQQKAILARWLAVEPTIVLADEPTRGVSIGSKIEIYRLLRQLGERGAAVVIVSSELDELVGLCHRIVLIKEGRTVAEVPTDGLDADGLLNLVLSS